MFAAIDEVRSQLGPIAILVNNAGMGSTFSRFVRITPEFWEQVFRVNVTGTFNCCQAPSPDMIEARWGRIVNISSSSAHSGQPLMAPYVSSKSAVNGLTKSLALEVGARGITVNTIPPGFIDTPMLRASVGGVSSAKGGSRGPSLGLPFAAPVCPRTSPPPVRSSVVRRLGTSPVRSSGSTAAAIPKPEAGQTKRCRSSSSGTSNVRMAMAKTS